MHNRQDSKIATNGDGGRERESGGFIPTSELFDELDSELDEARGIRRDKEKTVRRRPHGRVRPPDHFRRIR